MDPATCRPPFLWLPCTLPFLRPSRSFSMSCQTSVGSFGLGPVWWCVPSSSNSQIMYDYVLCFLSTETTKSSLTQRRFRKAGPQTSRHRPWVNWYSAVFRFQQEKPNTMPAPH